MPENQSQAEIAQTKHDRAPKPAPAATSSVVRRIHDGHLAGDPAKLRDKRDISGDYRVKSFRIALGPLQRSDASNPGEVGVHDWAMRGDIVRLNDADARSLYRFDAIETEEEYAGRVEMERRRAEQLAELRADGIDPFAARGSQAVPPDLNFSAPGGRGSGFGL